MLSRLFVTRHMIKIAYAAYHQCVGEHAVLLIPERPLVEVVGQGEAHGTGAQLQVVAEIGT